MKAFIVKLSKALVDVLTHVFANGYTYVLVGMFLFVGVVTLSYFGVIGMEFGAICLMYCVAVVFFGIACELMEKEQYATTETLFSYAALFVFLVALVWTFIYMVRMLAFVLMERM